MPYIKKQEREKWEELILSILDSLEKVPDNKKEGELNYLISSILFKAYTPSYFNYNRVIGLLECVKQEFYRRQVAEYEDEKIKENGDII